MATCDLCGSKCAASDMHQLRDCYKVLDIEDLCPKCSTFANKSKTKALLSINDTIKNDLKKKKEEYEGKNSKPSLLDILSLPSFLDIIFRCHK
jgi:hypothetical protein